jgi:uncharacterized membrane protein
MKFQLERILLFSDAVFAIAITLMIIEIKPPHLEHGISFRESLNLLLEKIPILAGTILSFFLIGLFWYRHHDLLKHMVNYDVKFIKMNLVLLLSIAFIPFCTTFVFENLSSSPLPLLVYNLLYIIASFLNLSLYNYALNPVNKLSIVDTKTELKNVRLETYYSIFVFLVVCIIAIFNSGLSPIAYSLFAFQDLILKRFGKT